MKVVGHYQYNEADDELGRGSFSRVYLARHIHNVGEKVAIKVMELPKTDKKNKHLLREIELMRHLNHENIVRLIDVQYEKYGTMGVRIFIVMEYCERGDMASLNRPLDEEQCKHYFKGIFAGLCYLKKRNIMHRDIKPQNILITADNVVKIADFTFSKQIEENELMQTQCGTPLYISPDVMFGKPYTDKSDLYSCGVMLYTFLYGNHPLGSVKSQGELVRKMKSARITFPQKLVHEYYEADGMFCRVIRVFSPAVIQLCKGLLKFNPADRITWDEIYGNTWIGLDACQVGNTDVDPSHPEKPVHAFSAPSNINTSLIPRSVQRPLKRKPVSGGEQPWRFDDGQSSSSNTLGGAGASRIIHDYYSTSPDTGFFAMEQSSSPATIDPMDRVIELSRPAAQKTKESGFLSRSIDAIQKVFSL